jgi:hypothetical protein
MSKTIIGEWLWRFLAVVMMFSVGWTVWIIYQLNPPPLIMNAAFEAAAKAKGKPAEKQSAQGVIAPPADSVATAPAAPPAATPPAASPTPETPKEPPINPEKLKFSETIALPDPVPNAKK